MQMINNTHIQKDNKALLKPTAKPLSLDYFSPFMHKDS